LLDREVEYHTKVDQPANVVPIVVAVITQVAAIVVLCFRLPLDLLLPFPSSFLLSAVCVMPPRGHVRMALAGHHATIILAVFQAEALQFVALGICVSFC
jgi:hypothetical protein